MKATFLEVIAIALGACLGWVIFDAVVVGKQVPVLDLIRDCSLTGTHVINNDTVVVCQVLTRTTTPQPSSKKPEISL